MSSYTLPTPVPTPDQTPTPTIYLDLPYVTPTSSIELTLFMQDVFCATDYFDCGNGIFAYRNPRNNCEFDDCPPPPIEKLLQLQLLLILLLLQIPLLQLHQFYLPHPLQWMIRIMVMESGNHTNICNGKFVSIRC